MLILFNMIAILVAFVIEASFVEASLKFPPRPPAEIPHIDSSETADHLIHADHGEVDPGEVEAVFRVSKGFLFVHGQYFPPATTLAWRADKLRINHAPSTILACVLPDVPGEGFRYQPPGGLAEMSETKTLAITLVEFRAVRSMLESGGVVILSDAGNPLLLEQSRGGFELIQSLTHLPGPQREELLNSAFAAAYIEPQPGMRSWLSDLIPGDELADRAVEYVDRVLKTERTNLAVVAAVRRFYDCSYPITVVAMATFVFSIGSLLAVRPQELVAVAVSKDETSVNKFLLLIAAMSIIDLVWTLLAHQANHITEINPVGGVLLDDPSRVILFKVLATGLAIGILYRARTSPFARKACWWVCLTLALLMARWIIVAGISA